MAKKLKVAYPCISNRYGVDEIATILRVLQADTLSVGVETGPEVQAFEREFACDVADRADLDTEPNTSQSCSRRAVPLLVCPVARQPADELLRRPIWGVLS